jgi:hypothetical protein
VVLLGIGCGLLPARKSIDRQNGAMTRRNLGVALVGTLLLAGCSAAVTGDSLELPPAGASFDYQLAGPYAPPAGVSVVVRDSTAEPAGADYDICYVNGFQTQPSEPEGEADGETEGETEGEADGEGEEDTSWLSAHPELILHDDDGDPVNDPDWPDEYLLDTSTALKRSTILALLGPAISSCAEAGYHAVEIDNLDSYTRSDELLTIENNIALAVGFADLAHRLGLAIAQKNGSIDSARLRDEVGLDFVIAEDCAQFEECAAYTDVYGDLVFDIEYDAAFLAAACEAVGSAVLRDVGLVTAEDPAYVFQAC